MMTAQKTQVRNQKNLLGNHPVKVTALRYLREALSQERYEEMGEITAVAKEFGATYWEIHAVLIRNVED